MDIKIYDGKGGRISLYNIINIEDSGPVMRITYYSRTGVEVKLIDKADFEEGILTKCKAT